MNISKLLLIGLSKFTVFNCAHLRIFFNIQFYLVFFSLESIKHDLVIGRFFFLLFVINVEDTLNVFYQYSLQHLFFTVLFLLKFLHSTLFFFFLPSAKNEQKQM